MSLFIAGLAFSDTGTLGAAKIGILLASLIAGVVGVVALSRAFVASEARSPAGA